MAATVATILALLEQAKRNITGGDVVAARRAINDAAAHAVLLDGELLEAQSSRREGPQVVVVEEARMHMRDTSLVATHGPFTSAQEAEAWIGTRHSRIGLMFYEWSILPFHAPDSLQGVERESNEHRAPVKRERYEDTSLAYYDTFMLTALSNGDVEFFKARRLLDKSSPLYDYSLLTDWDGEVSEPLDEGRVMVIGVYITELQPGEIPQELGWHIARYGDFHPRSDEEDLLPTRWQDGAGKEHVV